MIKILPLVVNSYVLKFLSTNNSILKCKCFWEDEYNNLFTFQSE